MNQAKIFLPSLTPEDKKDSKIVNDTLFQTIVHLEPITIGLQHENWSIVVISKGTESKSFNEMHKILFRQ